MRPSSKTTITDIASDLGISITAVSFILNGKSKEKGISDKLSQKVLRYADKMNYKPNALAKSFRTGKTNIIGLLVEDISNPFFATIARLIEERVYARGYRIVYCSTENNPGKTRELIQMFRDQHVDGYIIAPPEGVGKNVAQLVTDNKPVVIFDRYSSKYKTDQVIINNYESVQQAIQHLVNNGYKDIAFITVVSGQSQMQDRYRAYKDVLAVNGLPEYKLEAAHSTRATEAIISEVKEFLNKHPKIDAIFFANNYLAVHGLEAMKEMDRRDFRPGIISFDDHDIFRLYSPAITAIDQPFDAMADQITSLLFRTINEAKPHEPVVAVLKANLLIRESSLPR